MLLQCAGAVRDVALSKLGRDANPGILHSMGEAKRKQRQKESFFERHPRCCYCGGLTPATTRDHVPSIQMFARRRRPSGLEVPACEPCNRGPKQHEQVAALLGRIQLAEPTKAELDELRRIWRAVHNNNPDLLREMTPSKAEEQHSATNFLKCAGPLVSKSMQIFGAKLGFALHYKETGRIIPPEGGIGVRWYSNYEEATGELPLDVLDLLGPSQTLRQGRWEVTDQFSYAFAIAKTCDGAAYFSRFRRAFSVLSWINEDACRFASIESIEIHRPGEFRSS
jgi:hypothetical protein